MSLVTTLQGVPMYSTKREALAWAKANGLVSYHTHHLSNQKVYMGGSSHRIAVASVSSANVRSSSIAPTRQVITTQQRATVQQSRIPIAQSRAMTTQARAMSQSTAYSPPVQQRSTVSTRSSSSSGAISSSRSSSSSRTPSSSMGGY